jgi:two-component sensor histidine kinase
MISHELINNAARHAFARGMGEIRVELTCADAFFECRVMDNGSAAASVRRGRGLKIINDLTNGLGDGSSRALDRRVRCSWSPSLQCTCTVS